MRTLLPISLKHLYSNGMIESNLPNGPGAFKGGILFHDLQFKPGNATEKAMRMLWPYYQAYRSKAANLRF